MKNNRVSGYAHGKQEAPGAIVKEVTHTHTRGLSRTFLTPCTSQYKREKSSKKVLQGP